MIETISTSNVSAFPTGAVRTWREIEAGLRQMVREAGGSKKMADYATRRLRADFDKVQGSLSLRVPENAADAVRQLDEFHKGKTHQLLLSLVLAYAEVIRLTDVDDGPRAA